MDLRLPTATELMSMQRYTLTWAFQVVHGVLQVGNGYFPVSPRRNSRWKSDSYNQTELTMTPV